MANQQRPRAAPVALDDLRELIEALSGFRPHLVRGDTRFDELGLDSVDRLELLISIEDRYGVTLRDEQLFTPTVADVLDAVRHQLATVAAS